MEDDVGRNAALAREPQAHVAQHVEEIGIDRRRERIANGRSAPLLRRRRRHLAVQRAVAFAAQQQRAGGGQPQHRIRIAVAREQAVADELLDVAADRSRRLLFQQTESRQLVVPCLHHLLGRFPRQHVRHVRRAPRLLHARDARENFLRHRS